MRIMVTGGTGFVGSHTVAALLRKGHRVRLLVRNPEQVKKSFDPFGITNLEIVTGDVTDRKSVEKVSDGCEATIHCGSVYSLDPRAGERIKKTNVLGTQIVLDTATKLGHDPIVHVSSIVALLGATRAVLTPDSIPGNPPGTYSLSKADSDRVARKFQENGAPVIITYPGSVWGPNDPYLGESCQMVNCILHRYWSITPKGTVCITDVRDLANLHAALMEKGRGPRRYIAPVTNINIHDAMYIIASLTGRKLPSLSLPAGTLLWLMQVFDWLQFLLPVRLPFNYQMVYITGLSSVMDDSKTQQEFGIKPRPLEVTFKDTICWMMKTGNLPARLAGKLADAI